MPHSMDTPIAYEHRGYTVFIKFEWERPNDEAPAAARVIQVGDVAGLGDVAAELQGPWESYQAALEEAIAAAERWINSQLP
ncbi:hypothetical protein PPC_3519 [Pseudomonas protegens Cab57]|nr:hypothetical protein [Pseudomonas protegens]BAO62866.1 hypothetical protein PPC_3519 [Pseudomonas protegens Cab57]